MPLGIVSNEDFESEIKNSGTSNTPIKVPPTVPSKDMDESNDSKGQNDSDLGPIVTSDTLIKRLNGSNKAGRHTGDVEVPHSLRKLIGEESLINGRASALELANQFQISKNSVSAYQSPDNSSSLSDINKSDITTFLTNRKNKISKKAINKLGLAISLMDEDKLKDLKGTELSTVAKNMAEVVKRMEPEVTDNDKVGAVQFVMYAPQVKNESHYQTVIAKDNY